MLQYEPLHSSRLTLPRLDKHDACMPKQSTPQGGRRTATEYQRSARHLASSMALDHQKTGYTSNIPVGKFETHASTTIAAQTSRYVVKKGEVTGGRATVHRELDTCKAYRRSLGIYTSSPGACEQAFRGLVVRTYRRCLSNELYPYLSAAGPRHTRRGEC